MLALLKQEHEVAQVHIQKGGKKSNISVRRNLSHPPRSPPFDPSEPMRIKVLLHQARSSSINQAGEA